MNISALSTDRLASFPDHLLVDANKDQASIFVDPKQSLFVNSTIAGAMQIANGYYLADRESYIRQMRRSTSDVSVKGTFGIPAKIDALVTTDVDDADAEEGMLWTAPADDRLPKGNVDRLVKFALNDNPSWLDVQLTKPNADNALTKLALAHSVMKASGRPMPFAYLLNRTPPRAATTRERWAMMRSGNHQMFGRFALAMIDQVSDDRERDGKRPITTWHTFGAGITQRTLGVARTIHEEGERRGIELGGVGLLNTIIKHGPGEIISDHLTQAVVNEASKIPVPDTYAEVDQFQLRKDIDKRSELSRMIWQGQMLTTPSYFFGINNARSTLDNIDALLQAGVPLRFVNSLNGPMTANTPHHIPLGDPLLNYSTIIGREGQKVGMSINEHPTVVSAAMMLSVHDYDKVRGQR